MKADDIVLIIEDNALIASGTQLMLEEMGYTQVLIANIASEAEKLFTQFNPALALIDIAIGEEHIDGIHLAHKLNASNKAQVKIIFISAYNDKANLERIKEIKGSLFLEKPFSISQLKSIISKAMD
ncbi:MAG: response regulator [Bdellovibrionaceae bacterium]|jgi:two-component system, cell cycle sensor histidine kinase and response regulator CckA|nr:response regulator [Pseudobdellovibrionaceae bacterium]